MPATRPTPSLMGRALRLLSSREHSRAELEAKLQAFEEVPGALAAVLDKLVEKDFINEGRVVASILHRRAPKLGASRIQQELKSKGLEPQAVADAVAQLRSTELARAREVWRKKYEQAAPNAAERAKQYRFLATRGFSGDVIAKLLGDPHGEWGQE
jgi:regulatory protein